MADPALPAAIRRLAVSIAMCDDAQAQVTADLTTVLAQTVT